MDDDEDFDDRRRHVLPVVLPIITVDTVLDPRGQAPGAEVGDDLICGNCRTVLLHDFTIEGAQYHFVGQAGHTFAQCPVCLRENLLSTKIRE
jgi:hypothetical protein